MAIPMSDFRRVVAVAGLLASSSDGEALNATRSLCRLLGKHNLQAPRVIAVGLAHADEADRSYPPRRCPWPAGSLSPGGAKDGLPTVRLPKPRRWSVLPLLPWERKVRDLMDAAQWLTPWEADFLISVAASLNPDPKKLKMVDRIAAAVKAKRERGTR